MERKASRYAHNVGHTDVCYSLDGEKIITCGSDGDIRIWSDLEDVDPAQACVGEWALCVRQKENHLFVATDNNNVQLVTFPDGERDGILVRFTSHVNHIAVGKEHNMIAVVSEDLEVKVMDVSDTSKSYNFSGLTGPPLGTALCPEAKMLAVSSGDGFLRIWEVETQTLLKEIKCVPKVNSFMNAKLLCRIDFHPIASQRQMAYPTEKSVIILNTSDWSEKVKLSCHSVEAAYSIVQYSPCGNFLAAATEDGAIIVWDVTIESVVGVTFHPANVAICSMAWNPKGNGSIVFCDVQGQIAEVVDCISAKEGTEQVANIDDILDDIDNYEEGIKGPVVDDDDDEDNENAISLEKLKNDILGNNDPESDHDADSLRRSITPRPRTPEIPMQKAFMPTSTPEHLNPRYLCWNEVGVVRCYGSDESDEMDSGCSIEVEFHDTTFHNSMMMQNYQGYTMASLSTANLTVANSSQMSVIPLNSGAKEWTLSVLEEEEIVGIATSSKIVSLATSNYLVRVCSSFGIQKAVFSIPGPLVCMTAHEYTILVAYHSAPVRKNGDQSINMMLVKFDGMELKSRDIGSALGPESKLLYLGFTDLGTPAMQDSLGMLVLYPLKTGLWVPICDTSKHHSSPADGFFVTAIDEKLQSVRGIRCRGSHYPGFVPRPLLTELPLLPPFAELTTEKSQLEANLFAWNCIQVENIEKKYKETALKSFALACKSNLDERAIELVQMLSDLQLLNLAIKYSSKINRRLAEKLSSIASTLFQDEPEEDYENHYSSRASLSMSSFSTPVLTPVSGMKLPHRKLVLKSIDRNKRMREENEQHEEKKKTEIEEKTGDETTQPSTETPVNTQLKNSNNSTVQPGPSIARDPSPGPSSAQKTLPGPPTTKRGRLK